MKRRCPKCGKWHSGKTQHCFECLTKDFENDIHKKVDTKELKVVEEPKKTNTLL